jgi:serine/threonine protein kinase/dipeptidyl aminopeptidase/acylaminoacyl peptidase
MTLTAGTRLGPYEIVAPLGAGGMGEVYRARDPRLGREVAIKVLLGEVAADRDRLRRFELEARAASALNHPHIVTIYDVGLSDGTFYTAMELVEGTTLREVVEPGPLAARKLLDIAVQIADGLAKAHEAGIVHRDLKPENVMVSRDGYVKILDFGLAKLSESPVQDVSEVPTGTRPGMVMGTVGYMSPEQASGRAVDFRSDQFSLGSILYELATGQRAFRRDTSAETLTAIIREEPRPIAQQNARVPAPFRWIVERCLSKEPDARYASTRDLARDLAMVREHLSEIGSGETARIDATSPGAELALPTFQRLSFRRGTILSARFALDGQTVIYGASWDGEPVRLFSNRPESPESSPLMIPEAEVLSISRSGQMAVSLDRRWAGRFIWSGTLAQVPIVGGAPRELADDVQWADWAPDGSSLAVVRKEAGKTRLEYPVGRLLYETAGWISHPRVSPGGDLVAFLDHPIQGDDMGSVVTVDRDGRLESLSTDWITAYGLAWSGNGREIWFTATRVGVARAIWAVSLTGRERLIARTPGELTIQDVSADSRVLLTSDNGKVGIIGLPPGEQRERDLSLLDWSLIRDLSPDGRQLLFDESGEGAGSRQGVYLRKTDGSSAVRLGDGTACGISPDGRWVLSLSIDPLGKRLVLLPVKAGQPRSLPPHGLNIHRASWIPDGKRVLIAANEPDRALRLYLQSLEGEKPIPITPEGIAIGSFPVSPDGQRVVAQAGDQTHCLFPLEGGEAEPIPGLGPEDRPICFSSDGRSLCGFRRGELPSHVFRLDLASGEKGPLKTLMPADPAGVVEIISLLLTPDAASYAYSYHRILSDLFLVEGLK